MLPSIVVGIMLGAGAGTWVYSKTMRRTGGNTQNAIVLAAITGIIACIFIMTVLAMVDSALGN
jgi:hypothetical protein